MTEWNIDTYPYSTFTIECAKDASNSNKIRQLEGLETLSLYKALFVAANEINKWTADNSYRLESIYINYPVDTAPSSTLDVKIIKPSGSILQIKIANLNTYKAFDNTAMIPLYNYPILKDSIVKLKVGASASAIRIVGKPLADIEVELSQNDTSW